MPPQDHPHQYKDLVLSFTSILSQVVARKLPGDFDYHGVPAPWIQMRLLRYVCGRLAPPTGHVISHGCRILAILGADDLKTSEQIYPVIEDILASAECNSNIGQGMCVLSILMKV